MKTTEQTRRELFEAWVRKEWPHMPICRRNDLLESHPRYGEYVHFKDEWLAFNAALDAVVIELPGAFNNPDSDGSHAWNAYEREMRAAIESTSLGLKIR